jgi:proteic killer suppression protein
MIVSFGDAATEDLYHGRSNAGTRRFSPKMRPDALRKLGVLNAAQGLDDLRAVPTGQLDEMAGGRHGFYSLRVNDRWRIVFRWSDGDRSAREVSLTDLS